MTDDKKILKRQWRFLSHTRSQLEDYEIGDVLGAVFLIEDENVWGWEARVNLMYRLKDDRPIQGKARTKQAAKDIVQFILVKTEDWRVE